MRLGAMRREMTRENGPFRAEGVMRKRIPGQGLVVLHKGRCAGPLAEGSRQGIFRLPWQPFTLDGPPLGCLWSPTEACDKADPELSPQDRRKSRRMASIEENESFR